ncbi:hypothetical protein P3W45_001233 [Vairimorpha bombi]|jgi:hypothetical protein
MLDIILFVTHVFCIVSIRSDNNERFSIAHWERFFIGKFAGNQNGRLTRRRSLIQYTRPFKYNEESDGSPDLLEIAIDKYIFFLEDAKLKFPNNFDDKKNVLLHDDTELYLKEDYLGIYLRGKEDFMIHGVTRVIKKSDQLIFDLETRGRIVVLDSTSVISKGDKTQIVNPRRSSIVKAISRPGWTTRYVKKENSNNPGCSKEEDSSSDTSISNDIVDEPILNDICHAQ